MIVMLRRAWSMNMNRLRRLQHAYVGWRLTKTSIPRHPNLSPTRNYHTEDDLHPSTRARSTTQCTMRSSSPTTRISPSPSSVTEEISAVTNVATLFGEKGGNGGSAHLHPHGTCEGADRTWLGLHFKRLHRASGQIWCWSEHWLQLKLTGSWGRRSGPLG